ncbi:amphi-Trp domain-containing protein [Halostella litorea]|uniref:amphi-Trp domain-containing protein n=1 Tax=Halostella litorea TaxID=2528831 RepID=UPI0010918F20|nr:amphi-Trp domain-containing protein [Halostella litorea]
MAQRTDATLSMNREELGNYLKRLGDEIDGEGDITVPVDNRRVRLHPSEAITCDVEVVERSSLLRGSKETVSLELSWKPKREGT